MEKTEQPPDLGSQLEDILTYINNTLKIRGIAYHIRTFPDGPPACEMGNGPGKSYITHTVIQADDPAIPAGRIHFNYKGDPIVDSRECPNCGTICYFNVPVGKTIGCLSCGHAFRWTSI